MNYYFIAYLCYTVVELIASTVLVPIISEAALARFIGQLVGPRGTVPHPGPPSLNGVAASVPQSPWRASKFTVQKKVVERKILL
jgi:hypothetical protein